MPWWVAPLIMGGANVVGNALNKPKKYTPDTSYIDKFINSKKGDLAGANTYHTAMRGALRNIGSNANQVNRQIGYDNARSGLSGSGVEAQQRISVQQNTNQAVNQANESAMNMQRQENRQTQDAIDQAMMMKGQLLAEAKQRNQIAEDQYKSNLMSSGVNAVAGFASAGISNLVEMGQLKKFAEANGITIPKGMGLEYAKKYVDMKLGTQAKTAEQTAKTQQDLNFANAIDAMNTMSPEELNNFDLSNYPGQATELAKYKNTQENRVFNDRDDSVEHQKEIYNKVNNLTARASIIGLKDFDAEAVINQQGIDGAETLMRKYESGYNKSENREYSENLYNKRQVENRKLKQENDFKKKSAKMLNEYNEITNYFEAYGTSLGDPDKATKAIESMYINEETYEDAVDSWIDSISREDYENFKKGVANGGKDGNENTLIFNIFSSDSSSYQSWKTKTKLKLYNMRTKAGTIPETDSDYGSDIIR